MHLDCCLMLLSSLPDMVRNAKSRKTRFLIIILYLRGNIKGVCNFFKYFLEITLYIGNKLCYTKKRRLLSQKGKKKNMRLDGACAIGFGFSRREARAAILAGKITVNGLVVTDPARAVERAWEIFCDGEEADLREHVYLMLYKPPGTVCTTENLPESVLQLLPDRYVRRRIFPVGRLDKDTAGLLLLTDDGAFCHRLMSPKHHVEKEYSVVLERPLTMEDVACLEAGVYLENGEKTLPCRIFDVKGTSCRIVLREGKYHQVKRMFASRGNRVLSLFRPSLGGLILDPALTPGQFRELTAEEVKAL